MEGNGGDYSAYVVNERLESKFCRIELSTPIKNSWLKYRSVHPSAFDPLWPHKEKLMLCAYSAKENQNFNW